MKLSEYKLLKEYCHKYDLGYLQNCYKYDLEYLPYYIYLKLYKRNKKILKAHYNSLEFKVYLLKYYLNKNLINIIYNIINTFSRKKYKRFEE